MVWLSAEEMLTSVIRWQHITTSTGSTRGWGRTVHPPSQGGKWRLREAKVQLGNSQTFSDAPASWLRPGSPSHISGHFHALISVALPSDMFPTRWRCHCPFLELRVLRFKYISCLIWHWRWNQRAISHHQVTGSPHSPYPRYQKIPTLTESGGKSTPKCYDSFCLRAPVLVPALKCPVFSSESTFLTLCLLVWARSRTWVVENLSAVW